MSTAVTQQRVHYQPPSKPKTSFLFGMSLVASVWFLVIAVVSIGLFFAVGMFGSLPIIAIMFAIWAPVVVPIRGRTTYEWIFLWRQWRKHVKKVENMYLSGLFSHVANGRTSLPGVAYESRLHEGWVQHQSRQKFGVIELPATHQTTVIIECWPQGNEAIDQDAVDVSVFNWGTFLKYIGETSDIDAAVVVLETGPETGNRLRREVVELVSRHAPGGDLPTRMMTEKAAMLPNGSVRMWARVSITFRATTAERRKNPAEQIKEISRRMGGILTVLAEANLNPRMLQADEIVTVAKRAYSPGTHDQIERAEIDADGGGHDIGWEDAGPIAHDERPSWYYHDGCYSSTWQMDVAPTSPVTETVLRPVLDANGELIRKRVAIVYRPHSPAEAAEIATSDYKHALSGRNSNRKGVGSVDADLRVEATSRQREEQGRGHGLTLFGVLITVTVPEGGDKPNADAITKQLAIRSQLRIKRMFLQQAPAFAASIGIGVLLPDHRSISKKLTS